jgi:hypothetical protein
MPHLNNANYLNSIRYLAGPWNGRPSTFDLIPPPDQAQLQDFFVPSRNLSDAQLLEHRP